VGTRFSSTLRMAGRTIDIVTQVLSYDRPRLLASRTLMKRADIHHILRFEPVPAGTRMRGSGQVQPTGVFQLLAPVAGWLGGRQEQRIWWSMKQRPESQGVTRRPCEHRQRRASSWSVPEWRNRGLQLSPAATRRSRIQAWTKETVIHRPPRRCCAESSSGRGGLMSGNRPQHAPTRAAGLGPRFVLGDGSPQ
jgi:hypothetical protein